MEYSHLGIVVGAAADLDRRRVAQLAIGRVEPAVRTQPRTQSISVGLMLGLAAVTPRRDRAGRQIGEANAPLLPSPRADRRGPGVAIGQAREEDRVRRQL